MTQTERASANPNREVLRRLAGWLSDHKVPSDDKKELLSRVDRVQDNASRLVGQEVAVEVSARAVETAIEIIVQALQPRKFDGDKDGAELIRRVERALEFARKPLPGRSARLLVSFAYEIDLTPDADYIGMLGLTDEEAASAERAGELLSKALPGLRELLGPRTEHNLAG